jgi:hypothetical protein
MVQRILTEDGVAYRSTPIAIAALERGVSPNVTQPYRPQMNGKAQRFVYGCG